MNVIEDEPCPHCGEFYRIRWIDGDANSEKWQCTACYGEWLIHITLPTTTGAVTCISHDTAPTLPA